MVNIEEYRQTEQAWLGASILTNGSHLVDSGVKPDDHYYPEHQALHRLLLTHLRDKNNLDPTSVAWSVAQSNSSLQHKGATWVLDIIRACHDYTNIEQYTQILKQQVEQRKFLQTLTTVQQATEKNRFNQARKLALRLQTQTVEESVETKPIEWEQLWSQPIQPAHPIVGSIAYSNRITWLYSSRGVGKSLLAMDASASIAAGDPTLGAPQTEPQNVLYLDYENTAEDWADRLRSLGYGPATDLSRLSVILGPTFGPLDAEEGSAALLTYVNAMTDVRLIIIDTISKAHTGEENSNDTWRQLYIRTLAPLKNTGAAVLCLDHTGKDLERGARGGSAKEDNVDLVFEMTDAGKNSLRLRRTKARFRHDHEMLFFTRTQNPLRHIPQEPEARNHEFILACKGKIDQLGLNGTETTRQVEGLLKSGGNSFVANTVGDAHRLWKQEQRLAASGWPPPEGRERYV